ncbi:MAG: His/Gly/Thr/Pro-type tRNA ligase C-terminal domain-containing protein, partial [Flavobacteriales bacterium]|nr:His/Gly/Thr/Pro-type tRNA ligase C-terminal domain-containing protein [Flavobacteriales bacterium]
GRYDDLTGIFGLKDVSGVGVSFGADRIYDLMLQREIFEKVGLENAKILFLNLGDQEVRVALKYITELRTKGFAAELYPDPSKFAKQMKFADKCGFEYVGIVGDRELENGTISLKNMITGNQETLTNEDLIKVLGHEN